MELTDIIKEENLVLQKSKLLTDNVMHYCPGCTHGVVHKLIAEVIEELNIQDQTIGVSPVGCSVFAYNYIDIDWAEAAHGRAPAVATAISRLHPEKYVFTYQGDGDLASIGCAEIMHACNRGENIVVVFINNAIYGMTGGQMAPTTLLGQVTSTTPYGRDAKLNGFPMKITDIGTTRRNLLCYPSKCRNTCCCTENKKCAEKGIPKYPFTKRPLLRRSCRYL